MHYLSALPPWSTWAQPAWHIRLYNCWFFFHISQKKDEEKSLWHDLCNVLINGETRKKNQHFYARRAENQLIAGNHEASKEIYN